MLWIKFALIVGIVFVCIFIAKLLLMWFYFEVFSYLFFIAIIFFCSIGLPSKSIFRVEIYTVSKAINVFNFNRSNSRILI